MNNSLSTHRNVLDEFAVEMRDRKECVTHSVIQISPYLRQPVQSYAEFMARREQAGVE